LGVFALYVAPRLQEHVSIIDPTNGYLARGNKVYTIAFGAEQETKQWKHVADWGTLQSLMELAAVATTAFFASWTTIFQWTST
jgi:hypothetical protein